MLFEMHANYPKPQKSQLLLRCLCKAFRMPLACKQWHASNAMRANDMQANDMQAKPLQASKLSPYSLKYTLNSAPRGTQVPYPTPHPS